MNLTKFPVGEKEMEIAHVEGQESDIKQQVEEIFIQECYGLGRRKKDAVYLDLGANVGLASTYFKDWAKMIYAVEPNPHIYECLKKNTEGWDNIKTFNCGISCLRNKDYLFSSISERMAQNIGIEGRGVYSVACDMYPLDDFMNENGIEHVDVMKMDIEDMEYYVLPSNSFGRVADKIDFIIGEAHFQEGGGFPDIVPEILKGWGYKTEWWKPKDLEYHNSWRSLNHKNKTTGEDKMYGVSYNTIFYAYKD